MQRKYHPRTFFTLNLFAAFEFVDFPCKRKIPVIKSGEAPEWIDADLLPNVDIWRVRLPVGARLRYDVLFPGKAGWIQDPAGGRVFS
jgi:hypothetical protein